jgi:hypothetical protein
MRRPEVGIFALAMLASACAFPTESPNWDMTWNLPVPDNGALSISVNELVPSGITIDSAGTPRLPVSFTASVAAVPSISRTLGAQCPSCPAATAPKPAFTAPVATTSISLTAASTLTSATLITGSQIVITLQNGFGFDPINPPGGTPGTITLGVVNGSTTLGNLVLQGPTSTIPSGQTRTFTIPLSGTINTSSPINVTMTMDSPAGSLSQPVTMSPGQTFTASAVPTIKISTATLNLGAENLGGADPTPLDLSEVDSSVVRRIQDDNENRGTMFLTITNPFTVAANATITFRSRTGTPAAQSITPITKAISIAAATNGTTPKVSTVSIALTGKELRSMFGKDLEVLFGGATVPGPLTVTPSLKMSISSRIQVNFTIREQTP